MCERENEMWFGRRTLLIRGYLGTLADGGFISAHAFSVAGTEGELGIGLLTSLLRLDSFYICLRCIDWRKPHDLISKRIGEMHSHSRAQEEISNYSNCVVLMMTMCFNSTLGKSWKVIELLTMDLESFSTGAATVQRTLLYCAQNTQTYAVGVWIYAYLFFSIQIRIFNKHYPVYFLGCWIVLFLPYTY